MKFFPNERTLCSFQFLQLLLTALFSHPTSYYQASSSVFKCLAYLCVCCNLCHFLPVSLLFSIFLFGFLLFLAYSSLKQRPVVECSLSNSDTSEKKETASLHSPCDIESGPPEELNKIMTLEVLTLALPPQRLSDAETPLWKVLEGGSCKDTTVQISAEEGAKPLCRG